MGAMERKRRIQERENNRRWKGFQKKEGRKGGGI